LRGLLYKHSAANCKPQEFQVRDYVDIELPEDRRLVSVALDQGSRRRFLHTPRTAPGEAIGTYFDAEAQGWEEEAIEEAEDQQGEKEQQNKSRMQVEDEVNAETERIEEAGEEMQQEEAEAEPQRGEDFRQAPQGSTLCLKAAQQFVKGKYPLKAGRHQSELQKFRNLQERYRKLVEISEGIGRRIKEAVPTDYLTQVLEKVKCRRVLPLLVRDNVLPVCKGYVIPPEVLAKWKIEGGLTDRYCK
jgi:hypothetical protein